MGTLIDVILSNPILLMLIVGGLFSMMKQDDKKKKKRQQTNRSAERGNQQRKSIGDTIRETISTIEEEVKKAAEPNRSEAKQPQAEPKQAQQQSQPLGRFETTAADAIEEQRQKQYERLASNIAEASDMYEEELPSYAKQMEVKNEKRKKSDFEKQFKGHLTKKGLANSIIMAEVLGPPRSKQPYESIVMKRRR